ncbi:LysR family transcriptional regulator [Arthrobacter oryzae]|uniref:LysR family transcriptional regulator n=1 Tax=Arthrobacter oryzae TaxID=409290 RepID=UPI00273A98CF|nr:LysR family transcriptional regulator [Arthrobacter oryzae]WLQ05777.1 LysR family transcriptional regulator [Arthrobacter oryzae]
MEFKELEAFVAVAEELHFSRAAERLQIAQPPLSYRIQQLEKQLKIKLFNRNTRSVTLTDAGERLLGPARKVLADVELAQAAARSLTAGESGRVRLGFAGASSSKILPPLAQEVRRRYPGIDFVLQGQIYANAALDQVVNGQLDLGFVRLPIPHRDVSYRVVEHERLICALPSSHPLAGESEVSLEHLADDSFISFPAEGGSSLRAALIDSCAKVGITPRIVQEAPDSYTILALVAAGAGATLTLTSVQHVQPTGVAYLPIAGDPIWLHAAIAWRRDNASPALARVLEVIDDVLPESAL